MTSSLELHLFFGRIMKEHSLFLMAGFPCSEKERIARADWFRQEFEKILVNVVQLADGMVGKDVLGPGEVVTEYTEIAEGETQKLSGIPINMQITRAEKKLRPGMGENPCRQIVLQVRDINRRILSLLNGLITFKERVLRDMLSCRLYTTIYPLLIEHIIREAKLYRQFVSELERSGQLPVQTMQEVELFWNQIMMEHAEFIRGLLDPTECTLMETADGFADAYCQLLEESKKQNRCSCDSVAEKENQECRFVHDDVNERANQQCRYSYVEMTESSRELTKKYQAFKKAGVKGITECDIRSLIIPLLADHVLREANHYLRLLNTESVWNRNRICFLENY